MAVSLIKETNKQKQRIAVYQRSNTGAEIPRKPALSRKSWTIIDGLLAAQSGQFHWKSGVESSGGGGSHIFVSFTSRNLTKFPQKISGGNPLVFPARKREKELFWNTPEHLRRSTLRKNYFTRACMCGFYQSPRNWPDRREMTNSSHPVPFKRREATTKKHLWSSPN